MAVGTKTHFNSLLKEYWQDVAGSTTARSLNDAMRAGLEALGFTGSLSVMLKNWANDQAGTTGAPISVALKNAVADMVGETTSGVTDTYKKYVGDINFNSILTKFNDEDRKWSYID